MNMNNETARTPSRKAVVLTPLIYIFGSCLIPLLVGFTIGLVGTGIDTPMEVILSFPVSIAPFVNFFFFLIMTIILLKRYNGFFFSGSWKNNLYSRLNTGLKWSIPFIVVLCLAALIPEVRAVWLKFHLLINRLSLENITPKIVILISATTLVATFLEELIFRGMIQQNIKKFLTPGKSVLITAGIFTIAHFGLFFFIPMSLRSVAGWFLVGIFTGFAFNRYNSCISSFVPHLVFNLRSIAIVPLMLI